MEKCDANHIFIRKQHPRIPPATGRGSARPESREWKTFQTVQISSIVNRQQSIVNALFLPIMCKMLACRLKMNGVALKRGSRVQKALIKCQTSPNLYLQPDVFVVLFRYELPDE